MVCVSNVNYILLDLSVSTEHPYVALGPCCSNAHSFEKHTAASLALELRTVPRFYIVYFFMCVLNTDLTNNR